MTAGTDPVKAARALRGRARRGYSDGTMDEKKNDPRKDRLAAALRANLRRRKAQGRAQDGEESPAPLPVPDADADTD